MPSPGGCTKICHKVFYINVDTGLREIINFSGTRARRKERNAHLVLLCCMRAGPYCLCCRGFSEGSDYIARPYDSTELWRRRALHVVYSCFSSTRPVSNWCSEWHLKVWLGRTVARQRYRKFLITWKLSLDLCDDNCRG